MIVSRKSCRYALGTHRSGRWTGYIFLKDIKKYIFSSRTFMANLYAVVKFKTDNIWAKTNISTVKTHQTPIQCKQMSLRHLWIMLTATTQHIYVTKGGKDPSALTSFCPPILRIQSFSIVYSSPDQTPQNNPSTPRPCVITFQPAIKLTSHSIDNTSIGNKSNSVLCKNGKAL